MLTFRDACDLCKKTIDGDFEICFFQDNTYGFNVCDRERFACYYYGEPLLEMMRRYLVDAGKDDPDALNEAGDVIASRMAMLVTVLEKRYGYECPYFRLDYGEGEWAATAVVDSGIYVEFSTNPNKVMFGLYKRLRREV